MTTDRKYPTLGRWNLNQSQPVFQINSAGVELRAWIAALQDRRGDRATLRRAEDVAAVFEIPAFYDLERAMQSHWPEGFSRPTLARIAMTVAWIDVVPAAVEKGEDPKTKDPILLTRCFGERLAKAGVSEERLRRLARMHDVDLFLRLLRGALQQIDRTTDPAELGEIVRRWPWEDSREQAHNALCLSYFTAALQTHSAAE